MNKGFPIFSQGLFVIRITSSLPIGCPDNNTRDQHMEVCETSSTEFRPDRTLNLDNGLWILLSSPTPRFVVNNFVIPQHL